MAKLIRSTSVNNAKYHAYVNIANLMKTMSLEEAVAAHNKTSWQKIEYNGATLKAVSAVMSKA